MTRVATASANQMAADAGARLADEGGNAVDAALAAALVAMITEPGICGLGSGAFITIWTDDDDPVTVDGDVEMPGRDLPPERFGGGTYEITTEYGGGTTMAVGHGSVATPGALAALELASERFGRVPWAELFGPAIDRAREGFPMGESSHHYLEYVHESVYGRQEASRTAIHDADGGLIALGETIDVPDLPDSLEFLAQEGSRGFYEGDIGAAIAADMEANGGILTRRDLEAYEAVLRDPLRAEVGSLDVATNPPPAVGGAVLVAMLRLMDGWPKEGWSPTDVQRLVAVQRAVLGFRRGRLDPADDLASEVAAMLDAIAGGDLEALVGSPSTVHTSTADRDGTGCAVTASAGYGAGIIAPGTGIWLNNCLGELELNPGGVHALEPGSRLISNMAPTVARGRGGDVLAIGSPGADRITTAILQTLLNLAGLPLEDAIAHPRLHVDVRQDRILAEEGLPIDELTGTVVRFAEPHMVFGGVAAAELRDGSVRAAADPRRTGGTAMGGH